MTFIGDLREGIQALAAFSELHVSTSELPESASGLSDASVWELLATGATLARAIGTFNAVLAGIAAERSSRDKGHGGFSSVTGHRSPVALIQDLTGSSKGEAIRAVKVGEALLEGTVARDERDAAPRPVPWHAPLRDALLAGVLSTAQHNAILHGLGTPPRIDGRDPDDVAAAWRAAARELAGEAPSCTVEDLAARARTLRDLLDPTGAEDRFTARFGKRSYRSSIDADGVRRGHIVFDDDAGVWLQHLLDTALSPRRGGPRFIAADDKATAEKLVADPRSNEQLAYDLLLDLLRTGAAATADDVYGTKEPGVRLIVTKDTITGDAATRDAFGRLVATASTEDGELTLPGSVLERALCVTGTVEVTVDTCGNPLDVGREQRLFTKKQRVALAIRDGGCMWPGCDRPPAYCEAHHCAHWADGGRTDCDVGILLCRYHHLTLHNDGWRITREGKGAFHLHPPPGTSDRTPIPLQSKSPLRWLWDPPPDRPRWRTAA